jgi:hypothetical protein
MLCTEFNIRQETYVILMWAVTSCSLMGGWQQRVGERYGIHKVPNADDSTRVHTFHIPLSFNSRLA